MNYPGNKNIPGLIQKIVNQIPECDFFYELFAGSAAVSKFLSVRSRGVIFFINDLDPAVTYNFVCSAGSTVSHVPADAIIQQLISGAAGKETFVFLDPPYLHSVRPRSLNLYKFDMDVPDHLQLLLLVRDLQCNCMIIHPQCNLYDQELKSFRKVHVTVWYHKKTSHEILYMNYPEPVKLLTYDVFGSDCWDRQRIKRKGDRFIKKINGLPIHEKNYLLSRL